MRINKVNRITDSYTIITANVFVLVSWISFFIPPLSVEGRLAVLMTALLVEANISNKAHSEEVMCHVMQLTVRISKGPFTYLFVGLMMKICLQFQHHTPLLEI